MDSLSSTPVAEVLQRLHREAEAADAPLMQAHASNMTNIDDAMRQVVEAEAEDLTGLYRSFAANFLSVSPAFGRFLYMCARGCKAKRIVEFGSSMGISAIYMAAALRDAKCSPTSTCQSKRASSSPSLDFQEVARPRWCRPLPG